MFAAMFSLFALASLSLATVVLTGLYEAHKTSRAASEEARAELARIRAKRALLLKIASAPCADTSQIWSTAKRERVEMIQRENQAHLRASLALLAQKERAALKKI